MSSEVKFKFHNSNEEGLLKGKVKLTDLLSRLNEEKKKRKKQQYSYLCSCCISCNCFWYYLIFINTNFPKLPLSFIINNKIKKL